MRSQATKPSPKKGALSKTSLKASSATKQAKKKAVSPKKVKKLVNKSLVKSPKKNSSNDDVSKSDGEISVGDKNESTTSTAKASSSKGSRSNSPTKKSKKEPKERKDTLKNTPANVKKVVAKKIVKSTKKDKLSQKSNAKKGKHDIVEVKYKINLDVVKKGPSLLSKAKTMAKKRSKVMQKKRGIITNNQELHEKGTVHDNDSKNEAIENEKEDLDKTNEMREDTKSEENIGPKITDTPISNNDPFNYSENNLQQDTPKVETERPPKFFTSSRPPRTVDIDVKCYKNSKGNLSMSERFLSMKCETKVDDNNKDKTNSNTLVSQGSEIDVYTFTEKVDSPKSILSDFRNPLNKNIGRVRPIARVKGTVIDKKTDAEKKKFSPHRPIEEVVKQLKANKRSEDLNVNQEQDNYTTSSIDSSVISSEKEVEDKPKPIVSKSYKMVARKSSITGKPFSPIKFPDQEDSSIKNEKAISASSSPKKSPAKSKKQQKKNSLSDEDFDSYKFSLNTKTFHYTSSEESINESNDDNDTKESSESDSPKNKKKKNKKYKRITDSAKKTTSKELRALSKDSLIDLKEDSMTSGNDKPSKRHLKLLSMWTGPKKHRMASLNAIAKVHCLYENESRTHMELGLMKTVDRQIGPSTSKLTTKKKDTKSKETEKRESTSESEFENRKNKREDSSESSDDNPPHRTLRGEPGIRSAGKYWDPKSWTSSSEDSELEFKKKTTITEKKKSSSKSSSGKSDSDKPQPKMKKTAGVPVKKKRNRNEVVMDLKDMVVQKRMASLNATAILAASYEKRSPKSNKDETTSDSCNSDESFSHKSKNGVASGVKSEIKIEDTKKEKTNETVADRKQKVEVIVNQDTDVTITGVYSTHHHEGFCTVSEMQYRISSTSHTQTTATAKSEKEACSRDDGARYTPLSALSSMQPPAEHTHSHPHPMPPELGGLTRRPGCSSAFSAPSPSAHHEPGKETTMYNNLYGSTPRSSAYGYYQPAGPLIKESGADAERALARYHPPPHYHPPHPPVLQQYGPPYYPADLCYGRYYRPPGPYHMPPQPDAQMVGVGSEPYPPPQYYGTPPCYQHSPQRIPYVEYRGCPCPLNACPKNVLIGPATGKAPTGGGPADVPSALAPPGGAFRTKVRACAVDAGADTHGSGKDPPLEPEPPAAADAPHPCPVPAIGGASPKRELYDVRDNMRLAGDIPGSTEAVGPPSPARGSAGACAPQPPPVAPRRARLGKAMARRSLAGDDTGLLLSVPHPPLAQHSDADDDVMAISPPICAPIDLSSSDERSTPLVDVKKENEGPTYATSRKTDAQALREHNCTTALLDTTDNADTTKPVKRRYSRPKLEIDMNDVQLEDVCKTNGIGEHVKLQKRRKVSGEQTNVLRTETITKEPKKKNLQCTKRTPKTPTSDKKPVKRKLAIPSNSPKAKKMLIQALVDPDPRLKNIAALPEEPASVKSKTKSAVLLDNLLRKNSIDRVDADKELNPAELFLSPSENVSQNCAKKTLNINNNIVETKGPISGVRPNTIAAVSQLIEKKLAYKNACKVDKVDSTVTHSLKSVLKTPNSKLKQNEDPILPAARCKTSSSKNSAKVCVEKSDISSNEAIKDQCVPIKDHVHDHVSVNDKNSAAVEDAIKSFKITKPQKSKASLNKKLTSVQLADESHSINSDNLESELKQRSKEKTGDEISDATNQDKPKRYNLAVQKANGQVRTKSIESVAKLLVSKKPGLKPDEPIQSTEDVLCSKENVERDNVVHKIAEDAKSEKVTANRPKLATDKANGEMKIKSIEKVAKLLESKKSTVNINDAPTTPGELNHTKPNDTVIDTTLEKAHLEKKFPKRCKLSSELKAKNVEKVVKLLVSKKPAIKTDEATLVVEDACASPILLGVGKRTRRRRSGAGTRRMRRPPVPLAPPTMELRAPPRWSNGWNWAGEHYISKVYLNNDSRLDRTARCWSRMTHASGDKVVRGDCVLLRASTARAQPFVARVASLWENPEDGEMMVSLVWYYRPEHTERGREPSDAPDEVFASRHRDANSVACIEDKCYVLTFNEYCRYRKRLKAAEQGVTITSSIVPPLPASEVTPAVAPNDSKLPPSVSPELVLFCRKIYDFRSKKIQVPNK